MLQFVLEYWLNFLLGGIAIAITTFFSYQYSILKKMKSAYEEQEKDDYLKEVYERIDGVATSINKKLDDIEKRFEPFEERMIHVQEGVVAVQYDRLNYMCMRCLKEQSIAERDYINIQQLYRSYKENNGNHGMDEIYHAVMKLPVVEQYKED